MFPDHIEASLDVVWANAVVTLEALGEPLISFMILLLLALCLAYLCAHEPPTHPEV